MISKETKAQWDMISQVHEIEKKNLNLGLFDWKAQDLDINVFYNY